MKFRTFLVCIVWCITASQVNNEVANLPKVISLPRFNIRQDAVTVSGFSSGASMATQVHVSHSSLFHGVALFSQSFYRCGPNSLVEFGIRCSKLGSDIFPYRVQSSIWDAKKYEGLGLIDQLKNLENNRIFIWTGALDEWIPSDLAMDNAKFYGAFISNKSLINANLFHAKHLLPTTNFGAGCDQSAGQNVYLGNCNYSGAYHALEFLLRDKIPLDNPFGASEMIPEQGQLMAYNQSEFYSGRHIREAAMGEIGFIYIPKQCQEQSNHPNSRNTSKPCFLHINFHGCEEWPPQVALRYIRNNGFLPVADANGIITVFPLSTKVPQNMDGCWDFFSFTGPLFATKEGTQVKVVKRILDRLLGRR